MRKNFPGLFICIILLLSNGCAPAPEAPLVVPVETQTTQLTATPTRQAATPQEQSSPTPVPTTEAGWLVEEDRIVFTISNPEPFSGKEGEPRPDWLGWGAETFTVAPDGSFWIADTAVTPNRLLHYSPDGVLLSDVSLEDVVLFVYDIAATNEALWILEIAAEPPRIVKLDTEGGFMSSAAIPAELYTQDGVAISNGVFNLMVGENDEIVVFSLNGYYGWEHTAEEGTATHLDSLTYYEHTYRHGDYDENTGKAPIYVDDRPLELPADFYTIGGEAFVGFNPDGSFGLTGYRQREDNTNEYLVMYFLPTGELLGTARQHSQTFYKDWNHHLAFGPDGSVYQLLSNPDHSVEVVQLGFSEKLPADTNLPAATPTPLTPMLPSEPSDSSEAQAMNTLVTFFDHLSAGKYADGAALFGGEMDEFMRRPMPGESPDEYWGYICTFLWCLPVAEITDVEQTSEDEYIFYTVFMLPDGKRFEIGACCGGDPAASPPVWQFTYPVRKIDGEWKVMRAPLFTP